MRYLTILILVCGCTTPETVLKNNRTGQVAICGGSATGSLAGGMIGYHIQKGYDQNCIADHIASGFNQIYPVDSQ